MEDSSEQGNYKNVSGAVCVFVCVCVCVRVCVYILLPRMLLPSARCLRHT